MHSLIPALLWFATVWWIWHAGKLRRERARALRADRRVQLAANARARVRQVQHQQRTSQAVVRSGRGPIARAIITRQDHCNHPYQSLPATDLLGHLFDSHFELWNMLGESKPGVWRKEHDADHGRM